jgi:hypothetical protein
VPVPQYSDVQQVSVEVIISNYLLSVLCLSVLCSLCSSLAAKRGWASAFIENNGTKKSP